jgi:hypothetical protein
MSDLVKHSKKHFSVLSYLISASKQEEEISRKTGSKFVDADLI